MKYLLGKYFWTFDIWNLPSQENKQITSVTNSETMRLQFFFLRILKWQTYFILYTTCRTLKTNDLISPNQKVCLYATLVFVRISFIYLRNCYDSLSYVEFIFVWPVKFKLYIFCLLKFSFLSFYAWVLDTIP